MKCMIKLLKLARMPHSRVPRFFEFRKTTLSLGKTFVYPRNYRDVFHKRKLLFHMFRRIFFNRSAGANASAYRISSRYMHAFRQVDFTQIYHSAFKFSGDAQKRGRGEKNIRREYLMGKSSIGSRKSFASFVRESAEE